jgi:hypothetical protein
MSEQETQQPTKKQFIDLVKSALIAVPLALVLVIITLAMLGPSVGNIFSNIVNQL